MDEGRYATYGRAMRSNILTIRGQRNMGCPAQGLGDDSRWASARYLIGREEERQRFAWPSHIPSPKALQRVTTSVRLLSLLRPSVNGDDNAGTRFAKVVWAGTRRAPVYGDPVRACQSLAAVVPRLPSNSIATVVSFNPFYPKCPALVW